MMNLFFVEIFHEIHRFFNEIHSSMYESCSTDDSQTIVQTAVGKSSLKQTIGQVFSLLTIGQ